MSAVAAAVAVGAFGLLAAPGSAGAHFPHDVIAEVAVAGDGAEARIAAQYLYPRRGLLLLSEDGGSTWAFTAPAATREVLESLHVTPDGTLFAADAQAAAPFRSDDGGWSWHPTAEPDGGEVWCAVPSPAFADDPTVFACTPGGLFLSGDGGDSWALVDGLPEGEVVDVALAPGFPEDPFLVVLTGEAGLWHSPDGGESWLPFTLPDLGRATTVSYSPGFDGDDSLWVGTSTGAVLRTVDRGETWLAAVPDPDGEPLDQALHAVVALSADRVLAISADYAVMCSDDAGESWSLCDTGIPPAATQSSRYWGHYRRLVRPAGGNSPVALAAWEGLVLGKEAGSRWAEACVLTPDYVRAVGFSPGYPTDPTVWVGTYGGGVQQSRDGGETWTVLGGDKEHLFTEALVPSPDFPSDPTLFVVTGRRLLRSDDGGDSFRQLYATGIALVHDVALSPSFADDGVAYAIGTTDDEGQWVIARSDDAGESWSETWRGEPSPEAQVVSLLLPPSFPADSILYGGQADPPGIARSVDGGATWDEVLALDEETAEVHLLATDGGLLAIASSGEVWRAGATGEEWALIADLEAGAVAARAFEVSGAGGAIVLVSTDPPGLLRSTDGGLGWEELPTPFGSLILDMALPPHDPSDGTVLASTHYGTFVSCDDGGEWQLLGRLMRLEDTSCPMAYTGGGWRHVGGGTGGIATRSHDAGDALEVTFTGRGVRWLASRFPDGGSADVFIDDELVERVEIRAPEAIDTAAVFEHTFAEDGIHTLRLEVVGDGEVEVDAVDLVRFQAANGPAEEYEIGDWCIDLPEPDVEIEISAACCPESCDQARSNVSGGLLVGACGLVALALRRLRRG